MPPIGGIESYIRLVWLFTVFITVLMLLLCYLYISMRKAREQEQLSREFSQLIIEGLETERRRISRELHDTILPNVKDENLSNQIRSICVDLMPPDFSCLSFKDVIVRHYAQFSARTGIECVCSIEEDLDLSFISTENQLHLFRMIQESFNNIEKHSESKRACLVVRRNSNSVHSGAHSAAKFSAQDSVLICVSDEGVGLKTQSGGEGLGIRSLRQRAAIIGAKLDFISESGNGLMVRIELPTPAVNLELSVG